MNWIKRNYYNAAVDLAAKLPMVNYTSLPRLEKIKIFADLGPVHSFKDGSMNFVLETLQFFVQNVSMKLNWKRYARPRIRYHHIPQRRTKLPRMQVGIELKTDQMYNFLNSYFEYIVLLLHDLKNKYAGRVDRSGSATFTIRQLRPMLKLLPTEPEIRYWSHGVIKISIKSKTPILTQPYSQHIKLTRKNLASLLYSAIGIEFSPNSRRRVRYRRKQLYVLPVQINRKRPSWR